MFSLAASMAEKLATSIVQILLPYLTNHNIVDNTEHTDQNVFFLPETTLHSPHTEEFLRWVQTALTLSTKMTGWISL